jgi:hypothetical protein
MNYQVKHQLFQNLQFTYGNLTSDAMIILNKFKETFFVLESLDHDGCDKYGFKSDLWDLYIIETNEDNNYRVYNYYREDWKTDEKEDYELTSKKDLLEIVNTEIFDKFYSFAIRKNNNKLKKLLDNIFEKINIKK